MQNLLTNWNKDLVKSYIELVSLDYFKDWLPGAQECSVTTWFLRLKINELADTNEGDGVKIVTAGQPRLLSAGNGPQQGRLLRKREGGHKWTGHHLPTQVRIHFLSLILSLQ